MIHTVPYCMVIRKSSPKDRITLELVWTSLQRDTLFDRFERMAGGRRGHSVANGMLTLGRPPPPPKADPQGATVPCHRRL